MTPLLRLLYNIFYNLVGHRTKQQLFVILISVYIPFRIYDKNKRKTQSNNKNNKVQIQWGKPLITFSGGGQLSFYYQGISAYLRDNFDLENVRFAGISAGSSAAAGLASQLPTEAQMIFGLRWFKMLSQRKLALFLLSPSQFTEAAQIMCAEFGLTDEWLKEQTADRTSHLYYGVTNFSTFPPKHELVGNFQSLQESFYAMSCSMRILPFFKTPGFYKNMIVLDGGLSAIWSVPEDADPNCIVRITPSTRVSADIQPNSYDKCFKMSDVYVQPSLEDIYSQFERGYNDAIRCRPKLLQKGLKQIDADGVGPKNCLDMHLDILQKYGNAIFYNEINDEFSRKLKTQDLSRFLPTSPPNASFNPPNTAANKDR